MEDKIIAMIGEWLSHEPGSVTKESRLKEDLGADSLDKVEFSMELEDEFQIPNISGEDMEKWKTVQDVIDGVRNLSLDDKTE